MITLVINALPSPMFVFVFQMFLQVIMCYNHPNISIYAYIRIVQRSFTNYMYFRVGSMRVFLSKLCLSLEFEYV